MIKGFFIGEEKHVAILSIIFGVYKLRFHRFYPADCFRKRKAAGRAASCMDPCGCQCVTAGQWAACLRKSRPSNRQIASIHSGVIGMDACFSRSKATMTERQMHFTSCVLVSMTRCMR